MESFCESYPTWDKLSVFLTSEEGGKLAIRDCNEQYAMIWFKKGQSTAAASPLFRSVVWSKEANRPICIGPRKACEGPIPLNIPLRVEAFHDGVMVNVFATLIDGVVTHGIASRSKLGATTGFYSKKTFGEMFQEALQQTNRTLETLMEGYPLPTEEFPSVSVSFVLSHPEHRVVAKPNEPRITPVEIHRIHKSGSLEPIITSTNYISNVTFDKEDGPWNFLRDESQRHGWTWQGLIFRDSTGTRWRLRTPTYSYLRELRGNDSDPKLRFLRLRAKGTMKEYLKHYAEERQLFWGFEQELRKKTTEIFAAYCSVHKAHEKKLADIEQPHKTIVFKLHAHYLEHLRAFKKTIQMRDVVDLVNAVPIWEQALLLTSQPPTVLE